MLINEAGHRKTSSRLHIKLYEKAPIVKQALNKAAGHRRIGWSDYCVQIVRGEKKKMHYIVVPVGAFAQNYFNFQFLMTNKKAFLIENNSSTSSHNKNHDKSIFTKRKTFHALGAFCDIPPTHHPRSLSLPLSFVCVNHLFPAACL